MNVYQKINEVKKTISCFVKDASTSGKGSYTYISGTQILIKVKQKMEEVGLLFIPVRTDHRGYQTFVYKNSYDQEKTDFLVDGKLTYAWINIDEPTDRQEIEFEYYGQQNDLSKAFGSALTYSERYLLLKSLGVPTDEDDPDGVTDTKKQTTNSKPIISPQAPKTPVKAQTPSQYQLITQLIKNSKYDLASVTKWIIGKFGSDIKINDLTKEQFDLMYASLQKAIVEK